MQLEGNLSVTINPLGCRPSSPEHESRRSKTHDSYTTFLGTVLSWETFPDCTGNCGSMRAYRSGVISIRAEYHVVLIPPRRKLPEMRLEMRLEMREK